MGCSFFAGTEPGKCSGGLTSPEADSLLREVKGEWWVVGKRNNGKASCKAVLNDLST